MISKTWNYAIFDKDGDLSDYSDDFPTLVMATQSAEAYVRNNLCTRVTIIAHRPLCNIRRSTEVNTYPL